MVKLFYKLCIMHFRNALYLHVQGPDQTSVDSKYCVSNKYKCMFDIIELIVIVACLIHMSVCLILSRYY